MRRRALRVGWALVALLGIVAGSPAGVRSAPGPDPGHLERVGHDPLLYRGMNAGLAVHGRYAYVGSRTDGSHPRAGVLVVDVGDPAAPRVVGEIGPPAAGNLGETSRELRVWPRQRLLIVLNFPCEELAHRCAGSAAARASIRFFDIAGDRARAPRLIATYYPRRTPHEFYLWEDPARPDRALLYMSTPAPSGDQLLVVDISRAREGVFPELASWAAPFPHDGETQLHSLSVSPDGTRGYLAYLAGGFLVVDTSELARGRPRPRIRLLTDPEHRPRWGSPGAHSAVPLPDRPYALTTDEVYGALFGLAGRSVTRGCPWGWARVIDTRRPERPRVVAEYRIPENDPAYCRRIQAEAPDRHHLASYSSHNPTLTRHLAFITWHAGGLQAVSLADPSRPMRVAEFRPEPLPAVLTEDPALSSGRDKVVMWSYPVIRDGLIYVVDVRNGLYVLRYRGPYEQEVARIRFLEGNSNLGDARGR